MWWIIGAVAIFSVLLAVSLCRVSGDCSRDEEAREMERLAEKQKKNEEEETV